MRLVRHSEQPYTSDWLCWDDQSPIAQQIEQFLQDNYWVYDADVCGTCTHQFVVQQHGETTFWQAEHHWWIEYDPEWICGNEFEIQQTDAVLFDYPTRNRDWLTLT